MGLCEHYVYDVINLVNIFIAHACTHILTLLFINILSVLLIIIIYIETLGLRALYSLHALTYGRPCN